jgi:predicted RNA-binding Zn-ribbon protein involved in translation (DUF1610 family)
MKPEEFENPENHLYCPDCGKHNVRWVIPLGKLWSDARNERLTAHLYQCKDCKFIFPYPELE